MADDQVSGRVNVPSSVCSPCSKKGKGVIANTFCGKCEVLFCGQCLDKHNEVLDFHPIRDVEAAGAAHKALIGNLPTDLCEKHLKVVDMYCQEEDVIGCTACMALAHKSCERVHFIPDSTEDLLKSNDIEELNESLEATIESLKSINLTQQSTQSDLDEGKKQCLEEVDAHHTQLQSLLDNIIKASKDEIENRYMSLSLGLQTHRQTVERCLKDLKAAEDRLSSCHDNKAQTFIELKKCQKLIKQTDPISTSAKQNVRVKGLDINFVVRLKKLLTELQTLVTVVDPLTVKKKYEAYISVTEDIEHLCDIYGICVLNDGSVLLADFNNNRLKRFDPETLKVTDYCNMEYGPRDVCCVSDDEAVVTQCRGQLVFVSLRPRLAVTRTLTLNHWCRSVAYFNNELYITDHTETLYVYNVKGSLLKSITADPAGHNLFTDIRNIALSKNGEKVYVTDDKKGLITLDREGRVLGTLNHSEIKGPWGVCPDGSGGVFVCGYMSDNVVHVGRHGNILNELVPRADGLYGPHAVSYDRRNKRLYVSSLKYNKPFVFDVK